MELMCGKPLPAGQPSDCVVNDAGLFLDLLQQSVLIEGVLFRARYLGSTQLVCEGQPTKTTRMMQAEEAVSRIKVTHDGSRLPPFYCTRTHVCIYFGCCIMWNSRDFAHILSPATFLTNGFF